MSLHEVRADAMLLGGQRDCRCSIHRSRQICKVYAMYNIFHLDWYKDLAITLRHHTHGALLRVELEMPFHVYLTTQ